MRWNRIIPTTLFALATASATGSALASAPADGVAPDPIVGGVDVRRAIALSHDVELALQLLDGAGFGDRENPFGFDVVAAPDAIVAEDALLWLAQLGSPDAVDVDVFPDGDTVAGDSYTFGGVDDPSAIPGPHAIASVDATLPSGQLEQFVEFAVLIQQPGVATASADPALANDPNVGFNLRIGVNNADGVWNTTFEQWNGDAWQRFQNVADVWVSVDGSDITATTVVPARFIAGAVATETHVSGFPFGATDPAQAFFTRASPGQPTIVDLAGISTRFDEETLAIADAVIAGNPAAGTTPPSATTGDAGESPTAPDGEVDGDESEIAEDVVDGAPDVAAATDAVADEVEGGSGDDVIDRERTDDPDDVGSSGTEAGEATAGDGTAEAGNTPTETTERGDSDNGGLNPIVPIGGGAVAVIVVAGVAIKLTGSGDPTDPGADPDPDPQPKPEPQMSHEDAVELLLFDISGSKDHPTKRMFNQMVYDTLAAGHEIDFDRTGNPLLEIPAEIYLRGYDLSTDAPFFSADWFAQGNQVGLVGGWHSNGDPQFLWSGMGGD